MSIVNLLGGIVGTVGKVLGAAASIIKVARPIIEALRPAVDEVDTAMDWLEANAAKVGESADDFLDRNLPTLQHIEVVSARGVVVLGKLNELAVAMRVASQDNTPERITEDEAANFVRLIGEIRDGINPWRADMDAALVSLKAAEADLDKIGG